MPQKRLKLREWLSQKPRVAFELILQEAKLTPREENIIRLVCEKDEYNYQIAGELNVSPETVKADLRSAYNKIAATVELLRQIVI